MGMQCADVLAKSEKLRKENELLKNDVSALEIKVKSLRAYLEKYMVKTNMTAAREDTSYNIEEIVRMTNIMGDGLI